MARAHQQFIRSRAPQDPASSDSSLAGRHVIRWLLSVAVCAAAIFVTFAAASAAAPEVRGAWLTTTGPDHIASGLNTSNIAQRLRNIGLNTVYVESWKNGYTNFPSATMSALIGEDRSPGLGSRDLLHETLVSAHRQNMIQVAWFEYGFASQFVGTSGSPTNPLSQYMANQTSLVNGQTVQGWLLKDQNGNYVNGSNQFAWMNPAVSEVRQLLIDITLESIRNYDLDGVQFDDRLAWPQEFGWDETTAAIYFAETGHSLPTNVEDSQFRSWRQDKVAQFATELYAAIKAEDPRVLVSVSPSITGFSDVEYNAAWGNWVSDGLFDEYVPQLYRNSYAAFQSILSSNVAPFQSAGRLDDLVLGLRFNGTGADTPLSDLQQMIGASRTTAGGQLAGHGMFYSKGLIDHEAAMTSFYNVAGNGQAPHPTFGDDYRPDPLVGQLDTGNSSLWHVAVDEPGVYRVAALVGGRWKETTVRNFESGLYDLVIANASAVELLVSRRLPPIVDGDFNFDGNYNCLDVDALVAEIASGNFSANFDMNGDAVLNTLDLDRWLTEAGSRVLASGNPFQRGDANLNGTVDGADFLVWNAHKFTSTAAWCSGDFNADGSVDGSDFVLWNQHKFTSADAAAIPEPTIGWLASLLAVVLRRRTVAR